MDMNDDFFSFDALNNVSHTMLYTLAARGLAAKIVPEVGFEDVVAGKLLKYLPKDLVAACSGIHVVKPIAIRAKLLDDIAYGFFHSNPRALVVNLGAGLCTRGHRLRNRSGITGEFSWFDVDLPEVIEMRQQFLPVQNQECTIAGSILDLTWLDTTGWADGCPLLIVMEGVVPYLTLEQNRSLLIGLAGRLGDTQSITEIVFDYMHPNLVGDAHTNNQIGGVRLPFQSGFENIGEIRSFHPHIRVVAEYHPFSQISLNHALFETEFQLKSGGNRPYGVAHLRLNSM